jgi:CCR4-NOT transcription complex subunit 6
MSLLVCGDFNSLPDSAVYEIFAKGTIPRSTPAAAKYNAAVDWKTPFGPLMSAYQSAGEPHTNITKSFSGCLGAIFWFFFLFFSFKLGIAFNDADCAAVL